MKRYILFIFFLILGSAYSFGQSSLHIGETTYTTSVTYNSYDIYYIDGDQKINSGGSLNFAPNTGSSLDVHIICTGNYIFKISGTGALNVNGTAERNIYFTADYDNDGHETGEIWRNISFDVSTGTSVIDNAVIEYGTGNSFSLGGGVDIYGKNITIRNTTVRYCTLTGSGGGISVFPTGTISLQNLKLHDNTASSNGGGLYLTGTTAITVTGCDIHDNTGLNGDGIYITNTVCSITNSSIYNHSGGAGVYAFASGTGASIRNCVIYNNSEGINFPRTGNAVNCNIINNTTGITSGATTAPIIVNTVLWGNGTQLSGSPLTVEYCGIQGGYSGSGNVTLSSTNGDATGPNFVSTSIPDYHIGSWITPDVDGGTSSYTGITIPATDIEGRVRIGSTDIGAYEFLYYLWTGGVSSSWSASGNWAGSPASVPSTFTENKIEIPKGCSHYPVASSIQLSSRSKLTIQPQCGLEVTGSTIVDAGCTFLLKSDATGSANFISGSSVSGSFNVEMFLVGGGSPNYSWHYVMTPVNGHAKAVLTTNISNNANLLNYVETAVVSPDRNTGWQWHDGRHYTSGFSYLYNTLGYNVYVATDQIALFTGTIINNDEISFSDDILTCSGDPDPLGVYGWNLIGNPYTAGVDVEDFTLGGDIESTFYFTKNDAYLYYNKATHTGTAENLNIIPALQGFFVHAIPGGRAKTVTIPASSRLFSNYALYKKGTGESHDFPFLKLNVSDGTTLTDKAIIYFFKDASASFDGKYDAYKMLSENPGSPQIYTMSNNTKLAMNGLPYPDKKTEVPLKLRIGEAKNYTMNILDLENLDDYNVTLVHGNKKIDLKTNPAYTFYAVAGTIDDMSIIFDNISSDVNIPTVQQTSCWYSNGAIMIKTGLSGFEDNSSVNIYDINGKVVFNKINISIVSGDIVEIPVQLSRGVYITAVSNNGLRITKKIVITY
jgi:parallel beta-helix repeat protein